MIELVTREEEIAVLTLTRGKVNALDESFVERLSKSVGHLASDRDIRAVILTGQGKFFSFGFDIPEFLGYSKESFIRYLTKFCNLYTSMFLFPKPLIAALNGHTIAGGSMLAIACDYRLMTSGKTKIALNEITFGSTLPAGSVEMLKYCVGHGNAQKIVYSGAMYSAEEARQLGLVDQVCPPEALLDTAKQVAKDFAQRDSAAFRNIKGLLRAPVAQEMARKEKDGILEFADIWYSEETWNRLKGIQIHG
jgi:enoyl-CoA hydratase/carnithine racemase